MAALAGHEVCAAGRTASVLPDSWRDLPQETYRGWAPCAHEPAGKARLMSGYFIPDATVEDLLFNINMIGPSVNCAVDQWWGVSAEAPVWRDGAYALLFHTVIQGDTLLLALTETYKVWKAKHEEVSGGPVDEFLHLGVPGG